MWFCPAHTGRAVLSTRFIEGDRSWAGTRQDVLERSERERERKERAHVESETGDFLVEVIKIDDNGLEVGENGEHIDAFLVLVTLPEGRS
jgi:hypothetical protein